MSAKTKTDRLTYDQRRRLEYLINGWEATSELLANWRSLRTTDSLRRRGLIDRKGNLTAKGRRAVK